MMPWRSVIDLMRLRAGPQDMPGSRAGLALAAGLYALAGVVQISLLESGSRAVVLALLTTLLLAIYAAALLSMRGYPARFRQTAVALFATGTIFTVAMLGPDYAIAPYLKALRQPPAGERVNGNSAQKSAAAKQAPQSAQSNAAPGSTPHSFDRELSQSTRNGAVSAANAEAPSPLVFLAFIVAGVWRLIVYGHIFRNALEVSRWLGLAASFGFEVFLIVVFSVI